MITFITLFAIGVVLFFIGLQRKKAEEAAEALPEDGPVFFEDTTYIPSKKTTIYIACGKCCWNYEWPSMPICACGGEKTHFHWSCPACGSRKMILSMDHDPPKKPKIVEPVVEKKDAVA